MLWLDSHSAEISVNQKVLLKMECLLRHHIDPISKNEGKCAGEEWR